jgi:hypothetical protein
LITGRGFNAVVSNVAISLDLEMQLEETDDVEAILTDFAPLCKATRDGQGGGRRLQMGIHTLVGGDVVKFRLSACRPTYFEFCNDPSPVQQRISRLCFSLTVLRLFCLIFSVTRLCALSRPGMLE